MKISKVEMLDASAVFSGTAGFAVPPYQRAYKWDTEQTRVLVQDLLRALEQYPKDRRPEEKFFLGTLLIRQPPPSSKDDAARREIVDGQQRLVTLYLILAVIYELTNDDQFLSALYTNATKGVLRIELRSAPGLGVIPVNTLGKGLFLEQFLRNQAGSAQAITIRANYTTIKGELARLPIPVLTGLGIFINDEVQFVRVLVGSVEDAYAAFEVLNSRNTDVSLHELVRSFLLTKGGQEAEAAWQRVESLASNVITKPPETTQEAQDAFIRHVVEHAWLLTFGNYLTPEVQSSGAPVRLQFTRAREDLKSLERVSMICRTAKDIAQSLFDLHSQKDTAFSRADFDAIVAMKLTSTYTRPAQSMLIALNVRMASIPEHISQRLATVIIRAHIQNSQRTHTATPIKLSEHMAVAARRFFELTEERVEVAERVARYSWAEELYRDDEFVSAFKAYSNSNVALVRYLLMAIERKLAPDYPIREQPVIEPRFNQEQIEQALRDQDHSVGRTQSHNFANRRTLAYQLSISLGNWFLKSASTSDAHEFKTRYTRVRGDSHMQDPVSAIRERQEWLAQHAVSVWWINPTPQPPPAHGPLEPPNVFR